VTYDADERAFIAQHPLLEHATQERVRAERMQCNCVSIREALGPSSPEFLIGGHEPDCVATHFYMGVKTCSCPGPRYVEALGFFGFKQGRGYVIDRDPFCEIHGVSIPPHQ